MRKLLLIIAIAILCTAQMHCADNSMIDRANHLLGSKYPKVTEATQLEPIYEYPDVFGYHVRQARIINLIDSAIAIIPAAIDDLEGYISEKNAKDASYYSRETLYLWLGLHKNYTKMAFDRAMDYMDRGEKEKLMGYKYKCRKNGKRYEITFSPDMGEIIIEEEKKE